MPRDPFIDFTVAVEHGLYRAIGLLNERKIFASLEEIREIVPALADLEADRARVRADRLAYLSSTRGFKAPDPADIQKNAQLVGELDAMTAKNDAASIILNAAGGIIDMYNRTTGTNPVSRSNA